MPLKTSGVKCQESTARMRTFDPKGLMPKILIVSPVFWPESFRVNDLAAIWAEKGYEVEILAGHPNYPRGRYFPGYSWHRPLEESWSGVTILRFPQVPRGQGQNWRLGLQYASFVIGGTLRLIARGRWDWDRVLVFQTTPVTAAIPGLIAAKVSGAKSVIWVQDLWPDSLRAVGIHLPDPMERLVQAMSAAIYRAFTVVVGQSPAFLPRLEELGVEEGALRCVCNWGDEIPKEDEREGVPAWGEGFTVLFAGNLGRAQGLASVLDAAEQCREATDLQWVFMGDGVLRPWLMEEVRRRGLEDRVFLPGRRPSEEMSFHFQRAGLLLLSLADDPSLSRTVPSKLASYLASGRPVVGAVAGEPARVIEASGAGLVVAPGDPKALCDAVIRMYSTPKEDLDTMGRSGQAYYEAHFTKRACVDRLEAILREA